MNFKVLLNMLDIQEKRTVMSALVAQDINFVEIFTDDELRYKMNLLKDSVLLYIHELNSRDYDKSLKSLENVTKNKIHTIVVIDKYDVKAIDDAQKLGVMDVIVCPIAEDAFEKKLMFIYEQLQKKHRETKGIPVHRQATSGTTKNAKVIIDNEVNRAIRGKYALSFVLIKINGLSHEEFTELETMFNDVLRETDRCILYSKNTFLIICPFTPNQYVVDVENKLRNYLTQSQERYKQKIQWYIQGVTFAEAGKTVEELLEIMEKRITDIEAIDRISDRLLLNNSAKINQYKKMLKEYT